MDCEKVNIGGTGGFVCTSGRRRLPSCEFCHKLPGANQCDYLIGGPCPKCKGSGRIYRRLDAKTKLLVKSLAQVADGIKEVPGMTIEQARQSLEAIEEPHKCHDCAGTGKAMCNRYFCGKDCGLRVSEEEGYCPGHVKLVVRMPCEWADSPLPPSKCYRKACTRVIQPGDRCLLFEGKDRAMDIDCGEAYLRLTEAKK